MTHTFLSLINGLYHFLTENRSENDEEWSTQHSIDFFPRKKEKEDARRRQLYFIKFHNRINQAARIKLL